MNYYLGDFETRGMGASTSMDSKPQASNDTTIIDSSVDSILNKYKPSKAALEKKLQETLLEINRSWKDAKKKAMLVEEANKLNNSIAPLQKYHVYIVDLGKKVTVIKNAISNLSSQLSTIPQSIKEYESQLSTLLATINAEKKK